MFSGLDAQNYHEAHALLVLSACSHRVCDRAALLKCMSKLRTVVGKLQQPPLQKAVETIVALALPPPAGKDIAFSLDYSGSMSGARIKRAIENLLKIFDQHVGADDGVAFLRFNSQSSVVFPMCPKHAAPRHAMASSTDPSGTTAFRDSVMQALEQLATGARHVAGRKRWVVCLTDGEDNSSDTSPATLRSAIAASGASLIVVGIQMDAASQAEIRGFCAASDKGMYIDVSDNAAEMAAAFSTVASMITQDVALEEF